jgi:hypothetical protein
MNPSTPALDNLSATQREELLRRSWMANDGLWFYHTAQALGIDAANQTNAQVVREFGRQEMRRLMRALEIKVVDSPEKYRLLFDSAVELYLGTLIESEDSYRENTHDIKVTTCFAYKGVKRANIDKVYHCGPGERLLGWLEAMALDATIEPGVGLCQMAHTGSCGYQVAIRSWAAPS